MAKDITKAQMLEAIRGSNGIVTNIKRRLEAIRGERICWDTVDKYIHKWNETETALKSEKEEMLDMAEHNILKDIVERHDVGTSKWYLKMKGKERGYEDTPTIQIANEDPLNINLTGDTMTAEALKESADIEVTGGDPE
jgi:hypothetical protein